MKMWDGRHSYFGGRTGELSLQLDLRRRVRALWCFPRSFWYLWKPGFRDRMVVSDDE